jgi:hypothetical protein
MLTSNAQRVAPLPADRRSAFSDVQLLSAATASVHGRGVQSIRVRIGTHPSAARACGEGICRDARARASAGERTSRGIAGRSYQGSQAFRGASPERAPILAGAVIRLQRVGGGEGDREAEIHSP